ncbi:hypothetical protein SLEP1_g38903 [Rubroshorea leprosula]|uniref:PHD-type domain-containing protein n=1 Tax=Rubroshorea leprosula TaxID=152421 RepID=A0AAV5KYG0_9ROSI|nr:hypothetical protein SLEP1_g38903 [Rubroshorea leprosula]
MGEEAVCVETLMDGATGSTDASKNECKRDREFPDSEPEAAGDSYPNKKQAKETSNEDIQSEVSNPLGSPKDITSQPTELVCSSNQAGEVTSACLGNSSSKESLSDGGPNGNDTSRTDSPQTADASGPVSTFVTLEIPKHLSSSGIRKITFKFSKRKEDYDKPPSNLVPENTYGHGLVGWSSPYSLAPNMELKMSKKVVARSYPTNVKKLLATGILDGARVKYISTSSERVLQGIIHGGGYLCECSSCNFSKVLSAYEFEQHAGAKTRHPNNHIYLENGKPIYSIIQEVKTAPLGILDEVIKSVVGSSINEESFGDWKASLWESNGMNEANNRDNMKRPRLPNMVISNSVEGRMSLASCPWAQNSHISVRQQNMEMVEHWEHTLKRPYSHVSNSSIQQKRTAEGATKKRDNDLHRLLFMPNGLPDGAELAYYAKGQRLLEGYKQGNGIVCGCCDKVISPSQFEAHAGMAARRQPYRHIYTSNGLTLHDLAMSLVQGQRLTTGGSDDMCAICGDGGNLLLCHGCPQAFHPACLNLPSFPEGDWHCTNCRDKCGSGRKAVSGESPSMSRPIFLRLSRVVKAPEFEIGGCVVCREQDFSVATFDDRTVILCDQCEKEFHVGCLRDSGLCDLKEIPKDKWFCCDDCNRIFLILQNSVSSGVQMIPSSLLQTISRKHLEKGLSVDGDAESVQWQILSGKSRYPDHLPLLSSAAAIFRECFDPIVAKSGRDLIPVMVYGRNISGQEFGGMYCVVLIMRSVVVSAGLLRIFGREVAELPLVATTREHQGKGYFQALFSCIERLLSSLNVENLVLPAAEEALSIWTKKFGFRKMSEEQLCKYQRQLQLTIFKGTSMLEKEVQQISE